MARRVFFLWGLMQAAYLCAHANESGKTEAMQQQEQEVKETILDLIEHGSAFDVEALRTIYRDDLTIVKVFDDGHVTTLNKQGILSFLETKRKDNAPPLSKEVEFNYIDTDGNTAHVILTRRMAMYGEPQKSIYSIRLISENSRWVIASETVFVQNVPD